VQRRWWQATGAHRANVPMCVVPPTSTILRPQDRYWFGLLKSLAAYDWQMRNSFRLFTVNTTFGCVRPRWHTTRPAPAEDSPAEESRGRRTGVRVQGTELGKTPGRGQNSLQPGSLPGGGGGKSGPGGRLTALNRLVVGRDAA
jgi:hypothetical protein